MNSSNSYPQTQAPAIIIHVSRFQPFASRLGIDEVMQLQFDYDTALVSKLKAILAVYAVGSPHKVVGGWLPKYRCWFIEPDAWEMVKMELLFLGHRVRERKP